MLVPLIIACVAIGIFVAYNIILICMYGIPQSLSHTFYYLEEHGHWGWWFTFMMWIVNIMLAAPWVMINNGICNWAIYLCFLPIITNLSLLVSSYAANARKNETLKTIHLVGARIAAVTGVLWVCICCWKIMYVFAIWAVLLLILALVTKTLKFGRDFWIEWLAFGPVFTAIIWEGILLL